MVLFFALPWLMVILVMGTLAQKYGGLYKAQELYFSGWVLWFGPLPLPGSYPTIGLITLCLFAKFLLYSPWKIEKAGTILTHLGVLVLLIGGLVTALSQKEGFMMIAEGQTLSTISDYHARVVNIEKNDEAFANLDLSSINEGDNLADLAGLPFSAIVTMKCDNCRPQPLDKPRDNLHGLAQKIQLTSIPDEKEPEANLSGLMIDFGGDAIGKGQAGTYLMMEEIPHKPTITNKGDSYSFSMGRRQTPLPFSLSLEKFERDMHPGTDMARAFTSSVVVKDNTLEWPSTIRMNEPLRYKGYTFYQSSFSMRPDGVYSIFSVVQNKGRLIPYVASILIFAGLLVHLFLRLTKQKSV